MNARVRDMEHTTQGYFQFVIRLQVVRMQVHDKLRISYRMSCTSPRPKLSNAPIPLPIWLQYLRVLLDRWRSAAGLKGIVIEEVIWTTRAMGIDARAADWNAYGCLCLHLAETVEDLAWSDRSALRALDLLSTWVDRSEAYISQPSNLQTVRSLLEGSNGSLWYSSFDESELVLLLQALLSGNVRH
jgi:hypothetical protein